MNLTVARDTQGSAVGDIEAAGLVLRPMFDMVGMDVGGCAAILTRPAVAAKHRFSPHLQVWRLPRTFISQGPPALPMARRRPDHALRLTSARTVLPAVDPTLEEVAAYRAGEPRETIGPARLAAPSRISTIGMDLKRYPASLTSLRYLWQFGGHIMLALYRIEPKYVDVILQRWENFTGKTAVLDGD